MESKTIKEELESKMADQSLKIHMTGDYSQFRFIARNRGIDERNVQNIMKSVKQNDFLKYNPVMVDKKLQIMEGQHRFEASKRLNLPIYYVINEDVEDASEEMDAIITLQKSKKWSYEDYLNNFLQNKDLHYEILNDFMKEYKLNVNVALKVLFGSGARRSFIEGRLPMPNIKAGHHFMDILQMFNPKQNKFVKSPQFISALRIVLEIDRFDEKTMQHKIEYQTRKFVRCATKEQYLQLLEEIYNYNNKERLRFY